MENQNYNEILSVLEDRLKKAIKSRAEILNIREDRIEKLLNKEYSYIATSIWNTKTRRTKTGLGIQGREGGKMNYLKLTTKHHLFNTMKELVVLYRAYKSLDDIKAAFEIIQSNKKNKIKGGENGK